MSLALFLTLGNTLKLVNHSKSVFEFTQYASHPSKHADNNPVKGIQGAKYIEISEVEVETENEDQLHDLQALFSDTFSFFDLGITSFTQHDCELTEDIPSRPLFLLYCQLRSHLG